MAHISLVKILIKEKEHKHGDLMMVEDQDLADCIIIPMSWNYYYTHNKIESVLDYYCSLPKDKIIISFVFGDFGVNVPKVFKGLVFRTSGYRSKLPRNHIGMPIFIDDPLEKHYQNERVFIKSFSKKPTVGFCGQARAYGIHSLKELLKIGYKNMLSIIGYSNRGKEQFLSTTYLRWQILNQIQQTDSIISNFIFRSAYRAGVISNKDNHLSTMEFYDNIKNSDYIVCIRGAGNFSTRFYETLAMGRIPVFVNTDCLLPLDDFINWKDHIVWIDYHERHLIVDKIVAFHKKQNEQTINALFLKNRKLWENNLQLYSFFKSCTYEY